MPTVVATDDFNRADSSSLGANWSHPLLASFADISIVSNHAVSNNAGQFCQEFWSANTFNNDQYSKGVATKILDAAVVVRCDPIINNTFYMFYRGSSNMFIYRCDSGSFTVLADLGGGGVDGDELMITVTGTTLKGYLNGVQFGSNVTDTVLTSGYAGILGFGSSLSSFDSWEGGNMTSAVKLLPLLGVG